MEQPEQKPTSKNPAMPKAFAIGGVAYVLLLASMWWLFRQPPSAGFAGALLFDTMFSAFVTGLIGKKRQWSWGATLVAYVAVIFVVSILGWMGNAQR